MPDGVYNYELQLTPVLTAAQKEALLKARGSDDDPESERAARKRPSVPAMIQSGSFAIVNGTIVGPGAIEGQRTASKPAGPTTQPQPTRVSANTVQRLRNHRFSLLRTPDVVTADDEIIQGSLCVGLDCVVNESFGFDTIRLKENNTRIKFDDTSTSAGFPNNDWQLTANDSASGGANKFSIEDITGSKVPFTTSGGGFTAQTWDIGANEANWFVRDVTGGSRLPLRIRPGAPTSSVDINASGNVGIGTASPAERLDVSGTIRTVAQSTAPATGSGIELSYSGTTGFIQSFNRTGSANTTLYISGNTLQLNAGGEGNVGIGTPAPTALLSVNGTANKPGGGSWDVFSDERLKSIKGRFNPGLKAVMQLQPIRYEYKPNNVLGLKSEGEHIGFGAQSLQQVIPEAVTKNSAGYLMVNNDPIMWTMLNAIKEQQKEIEQLKGQIRKLRTASHRRRK